MAAAIFDIAKKLNLYFRIARNGTKIFTFVDTDGDPYSLSGTTFVLNIKTNKGDSANALQLTTAAGLSVVSNVLTVTVTYTTSALSERMYYWELYDTIGKKTWLFGNAYFTHGYPTEETETTTLTVNLVPDTVRITISGVSSGDSFTTQARGEFDASGDTYPASGGSGTAGAILKGDRWHFSVAGNPDGQASDWPIGTFAEALTDTPGQTVGNWRLW